MMKYRPTENFTIFLWGCIAALLLFAYLSEVLADECRGHSCNSDGVTTVDVTGGDVNVPVEVNTDIAGGPVSVQHSSKSLGIGLANGLGDVDIAGCLGSTQWATPLVSKQKLVINWPCLAEFYLQQGKYELAAMALCNTEIALEFESEAACEAAHNFGPPIMGPVSQLYEQRQQIEEFHEEDIEQVQMQQYQLASRIEALEKKPTPVTRVIQAEVQETRPPFTEQRRKAVFMALGVDEGEVDE